MEQEVREQIGARLRECRQAIHLTQTELAARLGVKRQALSRWENGKSMPLSAEWYKLAMILATSLDYLVFGIRTMPVGLYGVMARLARPQESQPAAEASDTPERLPAS